MQEPFLKVDGRDASAQKFFQSDHIHGIDGEAELAGGDINAPPKAVKKIDETDKDEPILQEFFEFPQHSDSNKNEKDHQYLGDKEEPPGENQDEKKRDQEKQSHKEGGVFEADFLFEHGRKMYLFSAIKSNPF
jgi:hypothetical protein